MSDRAKDELAFPTLNDDELRLLEPHATCQTFKDGEVVFRAGQADIDLFVVQHGQVEVLNPTDNNKPIVTHGPGEFSGDIDLLTRRPVIVTGIARGTTHVLRVPGEKLRVLLNTVPRLSEKLLNAFRSRREQLMDAGVLGMRVVGPGSCRDTTVVREFLHKNFVPFTWYDTEEEKGREAHRAMGSPKKTPAIECGDGKILLNPSLRQLADCAGIWRECPVETADLAVIGAGPAGIAAAVYAASEGLKTVVLDRIGPGGQAGGSSRIENFIGFPSGLSGAELAERGVLQMLKFGAKMVAPVVVERLDSAADENEPHAMQLDCGAILRAHVILLATGVKWRKLDVPGAARFERAGIYYACTQVEGYLHQGQDVAVVGAGNSAGQAAMFLAEQCAHTVHMLIRRKLGPGMSDYLASRIRSTPNIRLHEGYEVSRVIGEDRITGVDLRQRTEDDDGKVGATKRLDCSALFVFIGAEPHGDWLPDTVARDNHGYLLTGVDAVKSGRWPLKEREPCPLETTLPRVLAGGDVRAGSTKRVGFAVGDGSLAVTCVHRLRSIDKAVAHPSRV